MWSPAHSSAARITPNNKFLTTASRRRFNPQVDHCRWPVTLNPRIRAGCLGEGGVRAGGDYFGEKTVETGLSVSGSHHHLVLVWRSGAAQHLDVIGLFRLFEDLV